ncbi:MAG: hypothetical protein KDN20_21450 [Verrucomicrobiae bacterium]|nr:hypothetical protein [Verrucomicrobiae bacterium]
MNADATLFEFFAESFLKSGLIMALGLWGSWSFRRTSPEFRHRFWMPLLGVILILPALLLLPRWEVVPVSSVVPTEVADRPGVIGDLPSNLGMNLIPLDAVETVENPRPPKAIDLKILVLMIWLAGVVFLVLRLLIGGLRVSLWRRRAEGQALPVAIQERTEQLSQELGVRRRVTVILSEKVRSPFAWGWRLPLVALPVEASNWSAIDLEMVLRHELTHVARRDTLGVCLAGLVTAINWPNPLAWFVSKQLTEWREQICDREVLSAGHDSERYATLLFGHASRRMASFPFSATAVARSGTLEKRIAMILKSKPSLSPEMTPRAHRAQRLALAGFLVAALAVAFVGWVRPALAEPSTGNHRVVIHVYNDGSTIDTERLGFELDGGEEFGFDQLADKLRPMVDENTVLALAPAAPVSSIQLKRVIDVAEKSGFKYFIFEKREISNSDDQGEHEGAGKQIHITSRFVEVADDKETSALEKKLKAIVVPSVEFVDTPLRNALEFLQARAEELDESGNEGVNLVLKGDDAFENTPISLKLANVPLSQALLFSASLAGGELRVDENAIMIQPRSGSANGSSALGDDPKARAETERKLNEIILPKTEFVGTPLEDALDFLRMRSEQLDTTTADPAKKGINLVLADLSMDDLDSIQIDLKLTNVPLKDAIRYTADLANLEYRVQGSVVVIQAKPVDSPFQ